MTLTSRFGLTHLAICMLSAEPESSSGAAGTESTSEGTRIRPDLTSYQTAKSASGSSTKICGDEVSLALLGATLDEAYVFVSNVVGITETDLRAKYGDKNPGQQRMFLGNLIRGAKAGKDVEKKARVEAAFDKYLSDFRVGIDTRLKSAAEAATKAKADKQAEKGKEKAERKAKADEKAKEAKAKAEAKKTEAKPTTQAKPAQAKGPSSPSQPAS